MKSSVSYASLFESRPLGQAEVAEIQEVTPRVRVSGLAGALGEYIYSIAFDRRATEKFAEDKGITSDHVRRYLEYLISMRISQVADRRNSGLTRSVEVPNCVYPLLEAFGYFEDPDKGLAIKPVPVGIESEDFSDVITFMKLGGFSFNQGMPLAMAIDQDVFYRLAVTSDNEIVAAQNGNQADPATLLVRIFYDFEMLTSVYGTFRYSYGGVSLYSSAVEGIARLGLSK